MNARLSHEEMRDVLIAEKTAAHAATIRAKVESGGAPIIADGVTDLLCDDKLAGQLVRLSVVSPMIVGALLGWMTAHIIEEQAEVEALKEVEGMERSRQESRDDQRIEHAAWHRDVEMYGLGGVS